MIVASGTETILRNLARRGRRMYERREHRAWRGGVPENQKRQCTFRSACYTLFLLSYRVGCRDGVASKRDPSPEGPALPGR